MVQADTTDPYQAVKDAHAVLLLVEWPQFANLDLHKLSNLMQSPKYLFDTRNLYVPSNAQSAGLTYQGVGR
jgi:UDPglucose 6-dehydrogenase